jgi:hypothetical protein
MAVTKIYTLFFTGPNPLDGGSYAPGDKLDFFYDSSLDPTPVNGTSTGITVQLNNGPFLSGPADDIPLNTQSFLQETYLAPIICDGSTNIQFARTTMAFPYITKFLIPDAPVCDFSAPVCDLELQGAVSVVSASGDLVSDGEITVTVTSSRFYEFKLGSDFIYGDGTGQSSGNFTGLLPGSYRVYVRDAANCDVNVLVTVGVDNTYGPLHRLEYYVQVAGEQISRTKIEIQQRAYSGSTTEYCAGVNPIAISLRGEGELDKFYPMLTTNADISLLSESHFQFIHLFQSDEDKYRIVYFKDFGSGYETVWTGKVEPLTYRESYLPTPYEVSLIATDGLPKLKELTFAQPDGIAFTGVEKMIIILAQCLQKTGLSLDIRVACNLYAAGMDDDDNDDPLDQAYIDMDRFYLLKEAPTYDFVVRSILEPFGARVIQWENRWNIIRVEELYDSYDWREFDPLGNYQSEGTTDPVIDRVPPGTAGGVWFRDKDQMLEINPGYGKIRVNYDLGLFESLIRNGNFKLKTVYNSFFNAYEIQLDTTGFQIVNNGYALQASYVSVDKDNVALSLSGGTDTTGEGFVRTSDYFIKMGSANQLKIVLKYKIPEPFNGIDFFSVPYQKVRVIVAYGDRFLLSDGNWTGKTCQVATTANITLSGEQTIDGVLTSSSRVLVKNQSSPSQNGIYISNSGAWTRAIDADSTEELHEKIFYVSDGVLNGNGRLMWKQFTDNPTVGSSSIIFHNTLDLRYITIYVTEFGKYVDYELTAFQPDGEAVSGYDLNVSVYHSYVFHAQYTDIGYLRDLNTVDLPQGIRTELYDSVNLSPPYDDFLHYYELENTTDAESVPFIVRPDDYHSTTNPFQWVRKSALYVDFYSNFNANFSIDTIHVKYLYNGAEPRDIIVLDRAAQPNNTKVLEKTVYFGSLMETVVSNPRFSLSLKLFEPQIANISLVTESILSAHLAYGGWIRDSSGEGYVNWTRDGFSESKKLHEIFLAMHAAQYSSGVRRLSGSFISKEFVGFLHTINETFGDDKKYIPMSVVLNDKENSFSGEFVELNESSSAGSSPFSSAFTFGFGDGGFN